jgi:hypothetical protein
MTSMASPSSEPDQANRPPPRKWQFSLIFLFMALFVCALLFAWVRQTLVSIRLSQQEAQRVSCRGHFSQLALALHHYHDHHGSFPPAYVADASGKPMHSWRVLILPFVEEAALYQRYDFSQPWDGPNNRLLEAEMPAVFRCPASGENHPAGETNYVVIVGPGTAWPGATSVKLSEISDVKESTLLLTETHDSGISWLEPRDLTLEKAVSQINVHAGGGISSHHLLGPNIATADGRSREMTMDDLTPQRLRALLTIAGGD